MSSENRPSSSPAPRDLLIQEVLTRFDAYARVRRSRDSVFLASHASPQEEQRAFDDLQQAITALRSTAS